MMDALHNLAGKNRDDRSSSSISRKEKERRGGRRQAMVSLKCQEMSGAKSNGKPQFIRIYEQLAMAGRTDGGTGALANLKSYP